VAELLEQQFLTLSLKREKYAIPVSRVLEVLEYTKISRLPRMADYLMGLIDLRGRGVPVLDLALRLGLQETEAAKDTAIVVVEMAGEEGTTVVGLLTDAVHEVVEIASDSVEPPPKFNAGAAESFIKGIGRKDEDFILILDIDRLFKADELHIAAEAEAITA
jgi:purine-binding chemotaxis protein CheW